MYKIKGIKVKWSSTGDANEYEVWRKTGSGSFQLQTTVSTKTWTDSSVKKGKTYTYKIRPIKSGQEGDYGGESTVKTPKKLMRPKVAMKLDAKSVYMLRILFKKAEGTNFEMESKKGLGWKPIPIKDSSASKLGKNPYKHFSTKRAKISLKGYSFRIRTYEKINGKKVYSKWSAPKKV